MAMIAKTKDVEKEYDKLYQEFKKEDRWTTWFYQPHTVIFLLIAVGCLVYVAYTRQSDSSFETNAKFGIGAACAAFLVWSSVQMKDGLFVRPHPVLWRLVMGVSVIYFCLLVFLLFQKVEDVRQLLKAIDPSLGVPLPERSYADNCEFYTPDDPKSSFRHFMDTLNDEFIIAHLFGWFGKGLLLRDYGLCWILSISFELVELSLQHWLPNFAECWWDHIILDVLVCNFLGFYLGIKTSQVLSMKPFNWILSSTRNHIVEVDTYEWGVLKSWKRLVSAVLIMAVVTMSELNAFFLKFVLWLPPPHPVNVARLVLWWGIGLPGARELYQYTTDKNCKKLGSMGWMCAAILIGEILVWVKFAKGMFTKPTPPIVIFSWSAAVILLVLWALWYYSTHKDEPEGGEEKKAKKKKN